MNTVCKELSCTCLYIVKVSCIQHPRGDTTHFFLIVRVQDKVQRIAESRKFEADASFNTEMTYQS